MKVVSRVLSMILLIDLMVIGACGFIIPKDTVRIQVFIAVLLLFSTQIMSYRRSFYTQLRPQAYLRRPLMVLAAALILATVFSLDPYQSQKMLINRYGFYTGIFLLGVYAARLSWRSSRWIVYAFMAGGFIIACGGIFDYLHHPGRLATVCGQEINLTPLLTMYIPCLWGIVLLSSCRLLRTVAGVVGLLLLPLLIWNQSRSAWCAVGIVVLCIAWIGNRRVFYIVLGGLIAAAWLLLVRYGFRCIHIFNPYSWGNRTDLWAAAWGIFQDFPVFGAGLGSYERLLYVYAPSGHYSEGANHLHAHSAHLELLAEAGVAGVCAWFFLFIRFFTHVRRGVSVGSGRVEADQALLIGLSGSVLASLLLAVASTTIIIGVRDAAFFWMMFGAACTCYPQKQKAVL